MASALNMEEGSDTTTQTDISEEREKGRKEQQRETGGQINKVEPQVAIIYPQTYCVYFK